MKDLFPFQSKVTRIDRLALMGQRAKVIWFTGLSGSGKSTLASELQLQLHLRHFKTYLLDGDNIRAGLNKDLGFTDEDRRENIRRIGEVSKLLLDAGLVVLSAFISPFENDRNLVKRIIGLENMIEVFVDCPLEICEQRDVKGLYKRARASEVPNFTGISSSYETPIQPDLKIRTDLNSIEHCVDTLLRVVDPLIK